MGRFALVVVMLAAACEKKAPRYEGPLRVQLGDCSEDAVWVSGPRPEDPAKRVAKAAKPDKPDKPDDRKKPDDDDPAIARQQAIEAARDVGILGSHALQQGGAFASLTGTGDISSGIDDKDIYGGLGARPGGGGTGWGTIGTGRYGTIGTGGGTSGYGVGGGRGGMRGRSATMPKVSIGQPNAQGDLDKAIIRRYIKRNIQKIQYCYEKELLSKPGLGGTVMTQFIIKPDGTVASATGSGLDKEVATCVAAVIEAIQFPKPKGGGVVQVNYPFTFRPAAGSAGTPDPSAPKPPEPPAPPKPEPKSEVAKLEQPARYVPGANNPLLAQKDVLEECFRGHSKPYGVATVKLDWSGNAVSAASVNGVEDDVAKCVAEAAQKATRTTGDQKSMTCAVAFGDMPIADLPSIEITAEAIKLDGAPVTTPAAVAADAKVFKIDALFEKLEAKVKRDEATTQPVSIVGPIVIRPIDTTPIAIVNKAIATTLYAGGNYVLAASDGPSWRLLHDVDVPVVPVPRGTGSRWATRKGLARGPGLDGEPPVMLSVLVQKDQIWVGLSRVNEFQQIPALASKELDWEKLENVLKEHKQSRFFAGRTDLEIAGEDVTWIDLVRAIDLAKKVGFVDFGLSDPMALSARPTL